MNLSVSPCLRVTVVKMVIGRMTAMEAERLIVETHPDPKDVAFLEDRINEFNLATTGIDFGGLLAIFVRDAQGAIIAGTYGWTWGGCCEMRFLWVHEDFRQRGIGSSLRRHLETIFRHFFARLSEDTPPPARMSLGPD